MRKILVSITVLLLLYSCEAIFVEDISENAIVLLAPSNNAEIVNGIVEFNWQALTDATEYEIQIANPSFTNVSQILLDSLTTNTFIPKDIAAGAYEWRVRALNSEYDTFYTTNSFTIIDTSFVSKNVLLLAPQDKDTTNIKNQSLVWHALEGAAAYRVQIWKPDTSGIQLKDDAVSATTYDYEFPEGNFTWQVRGETSSKSTAFSKRTITIDTTAPNTASLNVPADNTVISLNTSIDFKWNRAPIAGSQELDSIYFYAEVGLENLKHKNKGASKEYTKSDFLSGDYYWFVKSFDTAGNESALSSIRKLTIN